MKCLFKHQALQMLGVKLNTYMSNFQPLEVVGRGSDTQPQVGEHLNFTSFKLITREVKKSLCSNNESNNESTVDIWGRDKGFRAC